MRTLPSTDIVTSRCAHAYVPTYLPGSSGMKACGGIDISGNAFPSAAALRVLTECLDISSGPDSELVRTIIPIPRSMSKCIADVYPTIPPVCHMSR